MKTVLGMMSGTSMDGIDIALLRTDGRDRIESGPSLTVPYDEATRKVIRAALGLNPVPTEANERVTEAHIRAIEQFLKVNELEQGRQDLVGMHGQTTHHDPDNGVTVQSGDGQRLADRFGIPVVCEFRLADVAAGGEGAPFAPLYHAALAHDLEKPLAVLNIGGVANVTWIGEGFDPSAEVPDSSGLLAFDTGPGNALLDDWVIRHTGDRYDAEGALASSGRADSMIVEEAMKADYFDRRPPKSLDRLSFQMPTMDDLSPADGAATLVHLTVGAIRRAREHFPLPVKRWLVCGGGRHNQAMMSALESMLDAPVAPVEVVGWDGDALEAQAFAWLAMRSAEGLPLSLPTTTGVPTPQTGGRLCLPN